MPAALIDTKISVIGNARTVRAHKNALHVVELDANGNRKQAHALPHAYSVYWPAFGGVPGVRAIFAPIAAPLTRHMHNVPRG